MSGKDIAELIGLIIKDIVDWLQSNPFNSFIGFFDKFASFFGGGKK